MDCALPPLSTATTPIIFSVFTVVHFEQDVVLFTHAEIVEHLQSFVSGLDKFKWHFQIVAARRVVEEDLGHVSLTIQPAGVFQSITERTPTF